MKRNKRIEIEQTNRIPLFQHPIDSCLVFHPSRIHYRHISVGRVQIFKVLTVQFSPVIIFVSS